MLTAATIGGLKIVIGGDGKDLDKALAGASRSLGSIDKAAARSTKYLASTAAAAIGVGVAMVLAASQSIDAQSKLARQLGGTVEGVQTLERASHLAGISQEEMSQAADRMNKRLGAAIRDGMSPAADALKRIGLNARDLSKLDIDERFALIADKIKAAGLNAQQTADLLGQLGIRAGKIFNLIEDGGKAFREARDDVRLFGVAVSDIDARMIERANDAWTVFGLATKGIGNQLAIELAPLLQLVADHFRDGVKEAGGMGNVVAPAVEKVVFAVAAMNREVHLGRIAWDELVAMALNGLDKVAGAIPRAIESLTAGRITAADLGFTPLVHEFGKLKDQLGTPPDPEQWIAWWKQMREEARKAAESAPGRRDAGATDNVAGKERERLEKQLKALKEALASEDLALQVHRDRQLEQIKEFDAKQIGTAEERNALKLEAEKKYQERLRELLRTTFEDTVATEEKLLADKYARQLEKLAEFEANKTYTVEQAENLRRQIMEKAALEQLQLQAKQWSGLASIVDTAMGAISGIMEDESSRGFTIMKAIATATALVKGYEAAVSAWATGEKTGIPGMGAIMAGVAAAGTAAIIAKIAGVGPKSGGTVSVSGAGGSGAAAAAAASSTAGGTASAPQRQAVGITLVGHTFNREQIRELIAGINDAIGDGAELRVT